MIHFDLPKEQSSIIKVIGVGGGGSNAVNHMFSQNIEGVNFIICNTDAQALALSKVPNKVQLGPYLTQGLGAGANPNIGRQATEESLEEIRRILEVNTKMAFITAGMGGGTGTGGAPIIAKICKDLGILTVGIVTTPFAYEGRKRLNQAQEGIDFLKEHVDTLLVISNDKLRHQFGNLKMKDAFGRADDVLATAAKCITDVINTTGQINVDFADVCTVMRDGGVAILGSAVASGENRAQTAIEKALTSPLLNDSEIRGAKWILININSAEGEHEYTMDEVEVIQNHLLMQAGEETDVILGLGFDNSLGTNIGITLIATGFDHKDPFAKDDVKEREEKEKKVILHLDLPKPTPVSIPVTKEVVVEPPVDEKILLSLDTPAPAAVPAVAMTETAADALTPYLKTDTSQSAPVVQQASAPEFVEISSAADQIPVTRIEWEVPQPPPARKPEMPETPAPQAAETRPLIHIEAAPQVPASGGYLSKPANIYAEDKPAEAAPASEPSKAPLADESDELNLTLIVKDTQNAAEEPMAPQTQPIMNQPAEEDPPPQDDSEDLRRRAAERLAKLRNLSFNVNAADSNNEFDTVPAYLRRNMDMQVQLADVESFYSKYVVKPAENNQVEISRINTFLDGKKPD